MRVLTVIPADDLTTGDRIVVSQAGAVVSVATVTKIDRIYPWPTFDDGDPGTTIQIRTDLGTLDVDARAFVCVLPAG